MDEEHTRGTSINSLQIITCLFVHIFNYVFTKSLSRKNKVLSQGLFFSHLTVRGPRRTLYLHYQTVVRPPNPVFWGLGLSCHHTTSNSNTSETNTSGAQ